MSSDVLEYLDAAVGFSYIQESAVGAAVCAAVDAAVSFEQRASALCLGRVLSLALESGSPHLPQHIHFLVVTSC